MEGSAESDEVQLRQDDLTAKRKCIRILRELEFRCMNSAMMNYELSSYYDKLDFNASIISSIAAGMAALPVAKVVPAAKTFGAMGGRFTKMGLGVILGATSSSVAYSQAGEYLLPNLRRKTKSYNKAGAAWQRLQLNIRGFLATSTMDQTTICEYRQFLETCAEKREDICNIARPESWSYEKYNSTCQHVIERYKRKNKWHQEFRQQQKDFEDSLKEKAEDSLKEKAEDSLKEKAEDSLKEKAENSKT